MVHHRREELVLLTESAVAVALSVLLGNLRLLELPNGGSIALATLPLLALALTRGVRVGVVAGCCAGAAHALAGGTIVHPIQLALDYLVAYAALGLAGLALGRGTSRSAIAPAVLLAMGLHLAAMVVSGVVFFAAVAGDAALWYSLAYNAATVVPETVLALWLLPPLVRAVARANPADAWRRGLAPPPSRIARPPRLHAPVRAVVAPARTGAPPTAPDTAPQSTDTHRPPTDTDVVRRVHGGQSFVRPSPFAPRRAAGG
jgi:thiamine transporter